MEKKALGKGLKALIGEPEGFTPYDDSSGHRLMLDEIEANPFQPRQDFDDDKLAALVASIKENGVLQPVIVRKTGDTYQIIAGERRLRAARQLNLASIPAIVRDASDEDMLTIALIENLQRHDLNPIEEGHAYKALIDQHGITQEVLANHVGKDRTTIANTMRLLNLPPDIQAHVSRGTLSMGHARALLSLDDSSAQLDLCRRIVEDGLSVRQVEKLVKQASRPRARRAKRLDSRTDPDIRRLEEELQRALGTKVRIRTTGKRGRIQIDFYSPDELQTLIERLLDERL